MNGLNELIAELERLNRADDHADQHHADQTMKLQLRLYCIDRRQSQAAERDDALANERLEVVAQIQAENCRLERTIEANQQDREIIEERIQQLNFQTQGV